MAQVKAGQPRLDGGGSVFGARSGSDRSPTGRGTGAIVHGRCVAVRTSSPRSRWHGSTRLPPCRSQGRKAGASASSTAAIVSWSAAAAVTPTARLGPASASTARSVSSRVRRCVMRHALEPCRGRRKAESRHRVPGRSEFGSGCIPATASVTGPVTPLRHIGAMTDTAFTTDATLAGHLAGWLRELGAVRRLAPKTLEAYQRDLAQFLGFIAGHTGGPVGVETLRDLRPADIRAYLARRRTDRLTSRSLARALAAIRSFVRYLEREGVVAIEALNAVRTPKQPRALPKALTVLEAKDTIAATADLEERPWVAARDMAVLSLCYGAGLRIAEALALTRADLEGTALRVTGKGGRTRLVPLIAAVRQSIDRDLKLCPIDPGPAGAQPRG